MNATPPATNHWTSSILYVALLAMDSFKHALIVLLLIAVLSVIGRWLPWPQLITYLLGGSRRSLSAKIIDDGHRPLQLLPDAPPSPED